MNCDNLKLAENCFRNARITGELADSSITKYRDSVKKFNSILDNKSFDLLAVSDFENFILKMRDNGASNSRIANVISAVKWVINYLQMNNMIKKTLDLEKVKKPKIDKKDVNFLEEEEVKMFLGAIGRDIEEGGIAIRKARAMALFVFLLQTGARIGETLKINVEEIDRQNMEVRVVGKGNKPRTLFLTENTLYWVDKYLAVRSDENKALFVSLSGKSRWQQTDVGRVFRRYRELSGIKKYFTIHTLRHTFATQYLTKGAGITVVQGALGHSNAVTTLKYYAGAVNKVKIKEMINDKHFDFIPESALANRANQQTNH